ncbi:MAG: hypothetical protein QOF15_1202, partial [Mycobacterium sp.]|nr:hypothetical protein [Mycobacterium sp.]
GLTAPNVDLLLTTPRNSHDKSTLGGAR